MVRAIAEDGLVTPQRFAARTGLGFSAVSEVLEGLSAAGMQTDESGNVVGAAPTARETPHKMRVVGSADQLEALMPQNADPALIRHPALTT